MPTVRESIQAMRMQMKTDKTNNVLPEFNPKVKEEAEAHIAYLNDLTNGNDQLPTYELLTRTTYYVKAIKPS